MRVLTIFGGVLMVLAGVLCFMNPGQTFLAMAFIIGLVVVLNGMLHMLVYLAGRGLNNKGDNNGWILVDALITLLLGIMVLSNQIVADISIHMVFGMWLLVTGVLRIEAASHINIENKRKNFMVTMGTGVVTTLFGALGFINPLASLISTIVLLGIFMVIQGLNIVELGVNMPHEKKSYMKVYKRQRNAIRITDEDETPEAVIARIKKRDAEKEAQAMTMAKIKSETGADTNE